MVPCLRIETKEGGETRVSWLYESKDILRYLEERYA
jgi:glutathione S-transferase